MNEKINALTIEAKQIVARIQVDEVRLVEILQELDRDRGYFYLGVPSVFEYCVSILKLSPAKTQNYLSVSRKAVEVPELKMAIASGDISICKARKIAPVINKANKTEWLTFAKESSTREIEKAVAKAQPQLAVKESVKYVADDRLSLTVGLSEETIEKLKRVMDLESQRTKKSASREAAITAALDSYLEKHDPLKKAERAETRAKKIELINSDARPTQSPISKIPNESSTRHVAKRVARHIGRRQALPSALVHAIHMRDQRQCTIKDKSGKRCGATRWLDTHHVIPRSLGGGDTLENLTTVCSAHHQMIHQRD
jgi:5-methylcytosine-specific restriction endonuclease McrA